MASSLHGKRVAVLVANGFEQSELSEPKRALEDAGADVVIVSPEPSFVRGWQHTDWGDDYDVDLQLSSADPTDFDALVLPGGQMNPDNLRIDDDALEFIHGFVRDGKPIGAICHGPWTLIEIDAVRGKQMTSYPSLRTDLENAGASWVDDEVVVDGNLVTSRMPDDLEAFCGALVERIASTEVAAEPREPLRPIIH